MKVPLFPGGQSVPEPEEPMPDLPIYYVTCRWPTSGKLRSSKLRYLEHEKDQLEAKVSELRRHGWTRIRIHRVVA